MSTQTLRIDPFIGINLTIPATVSISEGPEQAVTATGDDDIINRITTSVDRNGVWSIGLNPSYFRNYTLEIAITIPNLKTLALNGSGDINVDDFFSQTMLEVSMNGSGHITLGIFSCHSISLNASGSGSFTGNSPCTVNTLDITKSGSAEYKAYAISSSNCQVNSTSSGLTQLTATETLNVNIKGSGDVYYKGNPTIESSLEGSGKLVNAN